MFYYRYIQLIITKLSGLNANMRLQQLSKRVIKRQNNLQQNNNLFLRLKAEAVQLLSQTDLYRDHNQKNYYLIIQRISTELNSCSIQQQGEICVLLCQTAFSMGLSLVQIPLPQNFAQLVIQYINNLVQREDPTLVQNPTTRQIYEGKFKTFKQKKQRFDNQQKLRDLLLIERLDTVLVFVIDYLRQRQSQSKLSKKVIDYIDKTKDLAYRYLEIDEFQKFKNNLQLIAYNTQKFTLKKSSSTPIYQNFVIIDQKDTNFMNQEIKARECSKERSLHRASSRLQVLKSNSLYDSIDSSNVTEAQEQKRMIKGSQRLKVSIKRRSGSSMTKRGSIQAKKSVEYIVRKSTHYGNKQILDIKIGIPKNQRKSRFQPISKFDMNLLKEQSSLYKHEVDLNESESMLGSKKQTLKVPSSEQQLIFSKKTKEFYVFLTEKNRIWSLTLKPTNTNCLDYSQLEVLNQQKQFQLLFEGYTVFYCNKPSRYSQQENDCQEYYLQKLANLFIPYRNCRNQLVLANKGCESNKNPRKNIFQVSSSECSLLMGFMRKGTTHFIVQCLFNKQLMQNCYQPGIKRRLLTPNTTISFKVVYSYKLMNQDLYMTYQLIQDISKQKGSIISIIQKRDSNQHLNETSEHKYKIALSQSNLKQSEEGIKFITIWQRQTETMFQEMPRFKRKQTRSGTEIIMKQKVKTTNHEQKRIKRVPHNKSSIMLHQQEMEKIIQGNQSIRINSITRASSKKQVFTSEKLVSDSRILKKQKRRNKRINSGKQLIESIRSEKGYKLVRKCIVQNSNNITYNEYYGYLQRRANLIEYHRQDSHSFSIYNQNNYLKSRLTIHSKKNKLQPKNTKLLTFLKRLKNDSLLLGYLVGSIKLLTKDINRYVFMEVYWQSMQKYFVFIFSQDVFQKMTQIQLDQFEKHSFTTPVEKQQSKKREKRTSVVSSLMRNREKQSNTLNKSNESRINTLRVPKVMSIERENYQFNPKSQTLNKFRDTNKNLSRDLRTNNFFRVDKTSQSFSFSSLSNMKWTQRIHFKRQVVSYIKNKLIKYMQFSWKNYNLVLQLRHPNLSDYFVQIQGRELAVKNLHFAKKKHQSTNYKKPEQFQVSATQLLVIKYKQNNLANLKFYTSEGLNKIYLEHLFIKNSGDLFGCYKNNICLRQIDDNKYRIDTFYSSENGFFQQGSKDQSLLLISQPILRHFISKHSNKDEQKRYKYVQIINFAKKCSLSFDFIEKKRKKMSKNLFVIPNRYPHLYLKHFMLTVQLTFEQIQIRDLNGNQLLAFEKEKLLNYFPYLYKLTKTQLKKLLIQRFLKDADLIRLCQAKQSYFC